MFTGGSPGGRGPRDPCAASTSRDEGERRGGRGALDEAEAALLERAAGEERVARAAQPLGPRLVALLEGAHRLLVEGLDLVEGAAARRRRRRRAASGRGRPSASSTAPISALERPRARARRRPRPRDRPRAPSATTRPSGSACEVGQLQPLGLEGAGLRRAPRGSGSAAAAAPGAGCRSARRTGRSARGRRSRRARRRRPPSAAGSPGPAGAGARPGSTRAGPRSSLRSASVDGHPRARARAPRRCRSAKPSARRSPVEHDEEVQEARAAPAPAGGSRPRAARWPGLDGEPRRGRALRAARGARTGSHERLQRRVGRVEDHELGEQRGEEAREGPGERGAGPVARGHDARSALVAMRARRAARPRAPRRRRGDRVVEHDRAGRLADRLAVRARSAGCGSGRPRRGRSSSASRRSRGRRRPPRRRAPPGAPRRSSSSRGDLDRGQGLVEDEQRAAEEAGLLAR